MPKIGMEPLRRQQLIQATIDVVAEVGLQGATINLISGKAGLSSGIISHYFGGKQGLIEASVRHLLDQLKDSLLSQVSHGNVSPTDRLMAIIDSNFSPFQRSDSATKTWLCFWAQAMHDNELRRLQNVNSRRLVSNLRFSLKALMEREKAEQIAQYSAALIDGFWLRSVLSESTAQKFDQASRFCKQYILDMIEQHGAANHV
ncbi:transcriptional regulator BetI [Aliiglaciecola sp. LCG003]|uniref:transcriptional regulator BetI n=1 Tax=Aliiglaciecola sp. LCG003 TaxID=3053655 RepID=UPI002572B47F|nr:transcriptional regulator BetI [Aliiglaciecola sp. LCG003]WJG09609.1 transcriptional regulator BetI [Aliiglaciecola sp. LCG003]